jgi:TolA-binding protein
MFDQEQICREILKENREPLAKLVGGKAGVIFVGSLVRTVGVKEAVSIVLSHDHPEERRRRYDEMVLFATVTANMPEYETEWTSQLVEWADSPPFEEVAGKAAYNAASALARTGEYDDAIKYFETAIEREPNYKDRAYIFEELAAAKFEAGLYAEAIEDYRTAGDLEPDLNVAFRIADALFHLGRFADALKIFREADIPADGSYFRLRSFQCVELVEEMGFRNQTPEEVPDDVHESVQRDPITDKSQLKDFVQEILAHAPTDPILNYNAGHLARISGDSTLAFYRFLTSAMQDPGDADAWAQTVGAGLNAVISAPLGSRASAPLIALSDVVEAASFFIGREQLAEELIRIIPGDELTPDARNSFHKMLMQLARSVPDESPKDMLLRVFDDEEQQVDEWTFDP